MKLVRFFSFLFFSAFLFSCSNQKKAQAFYLDKVSDSRINSIVAPTELIIQKDDLLGIQVYSLSTQPGADALYNLQSTSSGSQSASGFLVDGEGNINYPRLGIIHAEGLTKQQLAAEIRKHLTEPIELLKNPTVIIRFLNFKITVLGEVGKEGVLNIPGEKVTVLEAVGLAGGVGHYGKKDRVKILREINGKRETGVIDLSSDSLFTSPYYYLAQNDVLIVSQTGQRIRDEDQARISQRLSFAVTLIAISATLYNIFK